VIASLRFATLRIPFTMAFRHASAERAETSSVLVEARSADGRVGYGEACPRPYVTGESLESARAFFDRHEAGLRADVAKLDALRSWVGVHAGEIDANPAAWCALELAVLDLFGKQRGETLEGLLSVAPLAGPFRYSAVLGDAGSRRFGLIAGQYKRQGFTDFKVKLSGDLERDRAKMMVVREGGATLRVRVDANNLWESAGEATAFLRALDTPLFAVEEPIPPNQYDELAHISDALGCKMVLDESFLRLPQLDALRSSPPRWLLNVRVSKMGGLLRSLEVVEAAAAAGIGVVVGAQVGETSVLTRASLTIAQAAGPALVAQEGAFGTLLLERDLCDPPLMFGRGGVLDVARYPFLREPGIGFNLIEQSA
jgi:L-Ala-D/L-Glu epimerase / N-acetyl-D-glutamate racemase